MAANYCDCRPGRTTGFTKDEAGDPVCVACRKPTRLYLQVVKIPQIMLQDRYLEFTNHMTNFVSRMRERRQQEIESLAKEYNLPERNIQDIIREYEKRIE